MVKAPVVCEGHLLLNFHSEFSVTSEVDAGKSIAISRVEGFNPLGVCKVEVCCPGNIDKVLRLYGFYFVGTSEAVAFVYVLWHNA